MGTAEGGRGEAAPHRQNSPVGKVDLHLMVVSWSENGTGGEGGGGGAVPWAVVRARAGRGPVSPADGCMLAGGCAHNCLVFIQSAVLCVRGAGASLPTPVAQTTFVCVPILGTPFLNDGSRKECLISAIDDLRHRRAKTLP